MAWLDPVGDLRTKLADTATDKLRALKQVFGNLNGTNVIFKTFEGRRLTNFQTPLVGASPYEGVYLDNVKISPAQVATDDPVTGYFTLNTPPTDGQVLTATYYVQWFLDTELQEFLRLASDWANNFDDWTQTANGLIPSVLAYAAAEAYQKQASRWLESMTETYRLEDAITDKNKAVFDSLQAKALACRKDALTLRDDFYKNRKGQALQPIFGTVRGTAREVTPNR